MRQGHVSQEGQNRCQNRQGNGPPQNRAVRTLPSRQAGGLFQQNPGECELFIVEGDSAGGSAKLARSRENQAVLPLRGKILNVEKASLDRISANAEIKAMISAFGTGILDTFSLETCGTTNHPYD